jgi:ABC-2 type transport system permease protein
LFILNAILFSITTITLAYALATIFKSQMMINALGTIISLGLAFITGIFIPQYLLGNSIKTLAQIFPSYWYIKTNNQIQAITSWAYSDMKPFYENLLIQLVFIAIFVGITFFISKKRMRAES